MLVDYDPGSDATSKLCSSRLCNRSFSKIQLRLRGEFYNMYKVCIILIVLVGLVVVQISVRNLYPAIQWMAIYLHNVMEVRISC